VLRAPIGKGDIDISACFRILRSANYSGAFAIEDNYTEELSDTAKDLKTLISEFFA